MSSCKNVRACEKRHPKVYKTHNFENGSISKDCAYKHKDPNKLVHNYVMEEKMAILEHSLLKMSTKMNHLEQERV